MAPISKPPTLARTSTGSLASGRLTSNPLSIAATFLANVASSIPVPRPITSAGAAALLAYRFAPHVRDILFAAHLSAEKGHRLMLDELKLLPMLDLQMRLGEGTGACLLMGLIEASVKLIGEMATFESAGVKEKLS